MDLSSLGATFEANKTPILAAAGAGVVGLGLYAKKKKATTASSGGGVTTAGGASSGGQTAGMTGGGAYDSSASDLYGAIQPQLESLGGQLTDLRNLYASTPAPTPVPAPTPAPPSTTTGSSAPAVLPNSPPTPVYNPSPYIAQTLANTTGGSYSWTPSTSTQIANGYSGGTIVPTSGGGSYKTDAQGRPLQIDGVTPQGFMPYATGPGTAGLFTGLPTTGKEGPIGSIIYQGGTPYAVTAYSFNGEPAHQQIDPTTRRLIGADYKPYGDPFPIAKT